MSQVGVIFVLITTVASNHGDGTEHDHDDRAKHCPHCHRRLGFMITDVCDNAISASVYSTQNVPQVFWVKFSRLC